MAGKLEGNLAALSRLQASGLAEGIDKGGKILISVVEYVAVCEIAYSVRGYGYSPGFILELYPLLQHPWMENMLIA